MSFQESIPVDNRYDDDSDSSGYESRSSEYSTESLTSSIYEYRYENGRRYHAYKGGKYVLPNDEKEQDRLDILHHCYLMLMNDKLHLAPIDPNPQDILDIGTGTGIWAIDAGERYPSAQVIGTDLSPIQPSWVPPNVQFQIDDAELDWTFKKDSFDLVHIRHLSGGIKDWKTLLEEAYKVVKPGGWIDIAEIEMGIFSDDGSVPEHLELKQFYDLCYQAAETTGRSFGMAPKLKPLLKDIGFINITHQEAKFPLGPWAAEKKHKELGAYILLSAESGFEAFGLQLFTHVLKMPVDEAKEFLAKCWRQANDRKIHSYSKHHFYYGQKPK